METLCFLPVFFIFMIVAIYSQSHPRPGQSTGWTDEDQDLMDDIILLDMMDDDDNW